VTTVEQSIDVDVPVRTAYNQWTQFEEFPRFMSGVEQIEQRTPTLTHWTTKIAGVSREFDAQIDEQRPDERIAWHSISGSQQAGVVTFHRLDEQHTRVMLQLDYEPAGVVEQAGDKLGLVKGRVGGDLRKFKEFIESKGAETGAWRGEVQGGAQSQGSGQSQRSPMSSTEPPGARPGPRPGAQPGVGLEDPYDPYSDPGSGGGGQPPR
jgi:uncharacterized membrane protein